MPLLEYELCVGHGVQGSKKKKKSKQQNPIRLIHNLYRNIYHLFYILKKKGKHFCVISMAVGVEMTHNTTL